MLRDKCYEFGKLHQHRMPPLGALDFFEVGRIEVGKNVCKKKNGDNLDVTRDIWCPFSRDGSQEGFFPLLLLLQTCAMFCFLLHLGLEVVCLICAGLDVRSGAVFRIEMKCKGQFSCVSYYGKFAFSSLLKRKDRFPPFRWDVANVLQFLHCWGGGESVFYM